MTHPPHLHAATAVGSLQGARSRLSAAVELEAVQQRREAITTAAAAGLQAWRPMIGRGTGGHGDPVGGTVLSLSHATGGDLHPRRLGRLAVHVDERLYWLTRGVPLDQLAALIPRTTPDGAERLRGWLAGLDGEIRTALGLAPDTGTLLPGRACPRCGVRQLHHHAAAGTVVCRARAGCVCVGEDCTCRMPIRVEGVAHIWTADDPAVAVAGTAASAA